MRENSFHKDTEIVYLYDRICLNLIDENLEK
jgi:hypothetical protein